MRQKLACALLGAALLAAPAAADAHAIAGVRVFPVTLTMDDPGVADEATLPQIVVQPEPGSTQTQFQWEFDKTVTPNTAIIYNHGYDLLHQMGQKNQQGFENTVLTGKWQALVIPDSEFLVSLGIQREFSGTGPFADTFGATAPVLYVGKGLGELPIDVLRPLAITGELSYAVPDRLLNVNANGGNGNGGSPRSITGSFSIQYSIPYLESQVRDHGLPEFIGRLVPLIETSWTSPMSANAASPATVQVAVGAIYLADTYQIGLEAVIPANRAAGANVGVIGQLHLFFDDIFPNSLGKPLFR